LLRGIGSCYSRLVEHLLASVAAHQREKNAEQVKNREALQQSIKNIEHQIEQLFDRIVKAESETLIRAYETKVMKLETEKASLEAKMVNCDSSPLSFEQSFQTVFDFLENPQKLWHSDDLRDRRLVLKLVFTRPLAYRRNEGFQTAAIALPFGLSGHLINDNSVLVEHSGVEPLTSCMPCKRSTS
jgi:site-specific DNA recombinase